MGGRGDSVEEKGFIDLRTMGQYLPQADIQLRWVLLGRNPAPEAVWL